LLSHDQPWGPFGYVGKEFRQCNCLNEINDLSPFDVY
jgi:hypothetical protein